jgi:iron-containing alcohol dehydrogenase-like protein
MIAIPTTAGTGSEVGRAAMINVDGRKLDFISPHLFPVRALCDPALTLGLPSLLTAATGMDALTHCIETYLSPLVNPPAEAIALDGAQRAARSIGAATANGSNRDARWDMMMASMEGALTFQKGLGAVHAMAHPLGALDGLPLHHGTLNAVLLPAVLRFNAPAAPEKYARLRQVIGTQRELSEWVADLNAALGLPDGLAAMGVPADVLPRIAEHAEQDPSTETNARPASRDDWRASRGRTQAAHPLTTGSPRPRLTARHAMLQAAVSIKRQPQTPHAEKRRAATPQTACTASSDRRPNRSGTAARGPRATPRAPCQNVRGAQSTPTRRPHDLRPGRSWTSSLRATT